MPTEQQAMRKRECLMHEAFSLSCILPARLVHEVGVEADYIAVQSVLDSCILCAEDIHEDERTVGRGSVTVCKVHESGDDAPDLRKTKQPKAAVAAEGRFWARHGSSWLKSETRQM